MRVAVLAVGLAAAHAAVGTGPDYFVPSRLVPGIGAGRRELTGDMLALRTEAMIQTQTFTIMREPQAAPGAGRINSPRLQRIFRDAEKHTGFPAAVLGAMAYLESWGVANAESPAGPRGIMQISEATARRIGLRVAYARRRRVVKTRTAVRNRRGKLVYHTVRRKETYTVAVRDDRLNPERAIRAAAAYLAGMERRYGGRDWAIWAYHCGEGCVADFLALARATPGLDNPPASVAQVFFGCDPAWRRDICEGLHAQMQRDYSPTYWFRVRRAQQLLAMYQDDPPEFRDLAAEYKSGANAAMRAPDRLAVWLRPRDLIFDSGARLRGEEDGRLARVPDDAAFFGYSLDREALAAAGEDWRAKALPAAIGTLAYIAFETRRLYQAMRPEETFVPLPVTALVLPGDDPGFPDGGHAARAVEHASGQVFDLSESGLPPAERECLRFVLNDLGWDGYLGFIEQPAGGQTLHIGCSPSSREFFAQVFDDMQAALRERAAPDAAPVAH